MREIIEWLLDIERTAGSFYRQVSEKAWGDEPVANFFLDLANEESWHFHVLKNALTYLENGVSPPPSIIIDGFTKQKIEGAFERNIVLLEGGNFSLESVLDCLATTEFSEWNDIFIYVMNILKEERQFMSVAARMHHHVKEVENFLEALPDGRRHLYVLRSLPPVWQERMLIVDDDNAIVQFLEKLFYHNCHIETASNGREGLEKLRDHYFDVIISDIQMPVMDGIEFYRRAAAEDPSIAERTLFFTGSLKTEHLDFLRMEGLRYLVKPAPIREIVRKVAEIMPP